MADELKSLSERVNLLLTQVATIQKELTIIQQQLQNTPVGATDTVIQDKLSAEDEIANTNSEQQPPPLPPIVKPIFYRDGKQVLSDVKRQQTYTAKPKPPSKPINVEKLLGANLIKYIGIAVFFLGITYFVKYAIDNEWISESIRVAVGMSIGLGLIGGGHYLHRNYRTFGAVLSGGGIALLYFSVYWGFQYYDLFSQPAALAIMVGFTLLAVVLAVLYRMEALAVVAVIGGFASPFLASTGQGNILNLFAYLLILNTGVTILYYIKSWRSITYVAFIMTAALWIIWYATTNDIPAKYSYFSISLFAVAFYILFWIMVNYSPFRAKTDLTLPDASFGLMNTICFTSILFLLIDKWFSGTYNGGFLLVAALIQMGWVLFFRQLLHHLNQITIATHLYGGIAVLLITLAIPAQFNDYSITYAWAAEAVILLYLSGKEGFERLQLPLVLVNLLAIGSLLNDWDSFYGSSLNEFEYDDAGNLLKTYVWHYKVLLNKGFGATVALLSSLAAQVLIIRYTRKSAFSLWGIQSDETGQRSLGIYVVGGLLLGFWGGCLEINFHQQNLQLPVEWVDEMQMLFSTLFTFLVVFLAKKSARQYWINLTALIAVIVIALYPLFLHFSVRSLRNEALGGQLSWWYFTAHYALLLLHTLLIAELLRQHWQVKNKQNTVFQLFTISVSAWILFVITSEYDHWYVISHFERPETIAELAVTSQRQGYTLLWGVSSFFMFLAGLWRKNVTVRLTALACFVLSLGKFFIADFVHLDNLSRIVSLTAIGMLLLVIAFLYEKLKRIIFDNE
jgi:uncharacterized membrane protein